MRENDFEPEITGVVRRYSEKISKEMPENTVAQSLGVWEQQQDDNEQRDLLWRQWLRFENLSQDPMLSELDKRCREVAEAWRTLKSHSNNLNYFEGIDTPPSIEALRSVVEEVRSSWEGKKDKGFGKAKDNMMGFLENLEGHKALFSVIPNNDRYLSLFTGVISSIVKASVNYEHIAQGFSKALADITVDLKFVRRSTRIHKSEEMCAIIIDLYVHTFKFLCDMMTWYSSRGRRFRSAFDCRFYDKAVEQKVTDIRRLVWRVEKELDLESASGIKQINEKVIGIETTVKDYMRESAEENRMNQLNNTRITQQLRYIADMLSVGTSAANLLGSSAQQFYIGPGQVAKANHQLEIGESSSSALTKVSQQYVEGLPRTREQLERTSRIIDGYIEDAKEDLLRETDLMSRPNIPEEVTTEVQRWLTEENNSFLWIEGSGEDTADLPLTLLALHVYLITMRARIPIASFFSKDTYNSAGSAPSSDVAGLVALLYSLIGQLVLLVPMSFNATRALTESNFQMLDGELGSTDAALDIVEALLELSPPSLILVLNGLEIIESERTVKQLHRLLKSIRAQSKVKTLKLLLTTSGYCVVADKNTDMNAREQVDAARFAQVRGRAHLPGGMYMSDVNY
ncbi:hypothetical protein F5Y15DRAFT_98862 [Xylariaceae sp. FL0016]|nr:hypothetical protein F5Y15DRAFT_98862 [Xylariaceae sp. FL0016]